MIVATTENVAGHRTVQTLGQCFGVVVRSRGLGGNVMAGLRSIVGGEIHEYTQLLEEARRHALDRLVQNATAMGRTPSPSTAESRPEATRMRWRTAASS